MNKKSSNFDALLSVQNIVLAAGTWGVIALLFFLLFSVTLPGQERPEWYGNATYILENGAFLGAGVLCFRNWRSPQIVSGRIVWLAIGLGMFSYFIGNVLLWYWEIALGEDPYPSPGDLFFLLTYAFLGWGMLRAVFSRQLSLTPAQLAIIALIGIGSIFLAYVLLSAPSEDVTGGAFMPPAIAQTAPPSPSADVVADPVAPAIAPVESGAAAAPGWVIWISDRLAPFEGFISLSYIIGDIILVVMATILLLAFWGGRFSLSWRFIAAAAFCLYIADIWFSYANSYIPNYETGALPEVFFVFSGCLFAIGAALEYDLSTRSRRTSRRRG